MLSLFATRGLVVPSFLLATGASGEDGREDVGLRRAGGFGGEDRAEEVTAGVERMGSRLRLYVGELDARGMLFGFGLDACDCEFCRAVAAAAPTRWL